MDTIKEQNPAILDYARHAKQLEKRRLKNAAEIEVLQKEIEAIRQEEERYQRLEEEQEMFKEVTFAKQQEIRQREFQSNITNHVIRGLRSTADNDQSFANAVSCISNDQGIEDDLNLLRTALLSELAGLKTDFLRDIAKRIKTQSPHTVDDILAQFEISHPKSTTPEVTGQLPVTSDLPSDVAIPAAHTSTLEAAPSIKRQNKTVVKRLIDTSGQVKRKSDASVDSEPCNTGRKKKARTSNTASKLIT